jgi:hypothetical protein
VEVDNKDDLKVDQIHAYEGTDKAENKGQEGTTQFYSHQVAGEEFRADSHFKKTFCFRPCCIGFRKFIFLIGALLAVSNQAFDIVYAFQSPYQS